MPSSSLLMSGTALMMSPESLMSLVSLLSFLMFLVTMMVSSSLRSLISSILQALGSSSGYILSTLRHTLWMRSKMPTER
jgi:hypothetical protein